MSIVPGYRLEHLLRSSSSARVWAATRVQDNKAVVAKIFAIEDRADLEARVQHEFELIRRLEMPGVVRALALERSGRDLVLVLEAHPGVDLAKHTGGMPLALDPFFTIATSIAHTLASVHATRVIHRDIKPTNILITPETEAVALADFGISVLLDSERARIHDPEIVEGSLPYMAPEQTGRTGRNVDTRSDLYSLGVTFYELLTGRRPFEGGTPLELIHAHLARRPEDPQRLRPELPTALARLVLELLEKAPERRYQSARGLAADLEALHTAWREHDADTLDHFELGLRDVPTQLRLPHQLYGRAAEREQLLAAFRRASEGTPGFVLIAGEPGTGKSALLDELIEPTLARRGFLARGRFERNSDEPFTAVSAALTSLADQLLTTSADELDRWRTLLLDELAGFAPVVCKLVPRFVRVLGEVGDGPALAPAEARNQVRLAFSRLLARFAQPEHPLVLALDDVQWADLGSLELIENLLSDPTAAILILAAARPEALEPGNHVSDLLGRLRERQHEIVELQLGPLEREDLCELVADVLSRSREQVASLAEIVARKTGRNPFFARQFLLHLAERGLVTCGASGWTWDAAALESASLPDDALGMMTAKLERLEPGLRELIEVACVFGNEFDPLAVERVLTGPGAKFHELVDEGLIAPLAGRGYMFGHDRIREAAYGLLDDERRRALHLAVGDDLLAHLDAAELESRVFEIADHLDRGHALIDDDFAAGASMRARTLEPDRARQLAELNVRAGRRALASGAPDSARAYLEVGTRLLATIAESAESAQSAERDRAADRDRAAHTLAFEAELALGQAEALTGAYADADARLSKLLARPLDHGDLQRAAVARIWLLVLAGRSTESIAFGCQTLRELGIAIPQRVGKFTIAALLPRMQRMARPETLVQIAGRPAITDPALLAAMEVLQALGHTAYVTEPMTWVLLVARHADLLRRHGNHSSAGLVFAQVGLVLANTLGRRAEAVTLASVCLQHEVERASPNVYRLRMLKSFASIWTAPYHDLLPEIREVIERAQEYGDIEAADSGWATYIELSFYGGSHLRVVQDHVDARVAWAHKWGTEHLSGGFMFIGACRRLIDGPPPAEGEHDPLALGSLADRGLRELSQCAGRMLAAVVFSVYGCWRTAASEIDEVFDRIERALPGTWYGFIMRVLAGVAAAVMHDQANGRERRRLARRVGHYADELARAIVKHGNFAHGEALLRAEQARIAGHIERAGTLYLRARAAAAKQRHTMLEAIICERMAALMLEHGLEPFAHGPLLDARALYLRWGAFGKVAQLDRQFPTLDNRPGTRPGTRLDDSRSSDDSSSSTTSTALDTATLLKTSQAIAEDIELDDVITRVMSIVLENAGAERSVLLLVLDGELALAAECHIEPDRSVRVRSRASPGQGLQRLAEIGDRVPASLLRWVERTREPIVLADAREDRRFASDPYFQTGGSRSVLCQPVIKHGRLIGLLYLENNLSAGSFTAQRLEVLRLLTAQAASALENARLYGDLRVSEVRWRSLVEQLPDHVALVDRAGNIDYINRGAAQTLEFLAQPTSSSPIAELLARVFADGRQAAIEIDDPRPDGELRGHALRMAPVVLDGRIEHVILVATDISERRKAEAKRRELEAQLRQQQRLEAIGTLASGVAHEINNPVQGIMNYAELIQQMDSADETVREFAVEIEHETKRVTTIVRNLLAFSRQDQQAAMERTTVADIIQATISLLRAVLRKDQIQLEIAVPDGLPALTCRSQQIQQVVMNLVANARDALRERYPEFDEDKRIDIAGASFVRDDRDWVRITVADRGGGIPGDVVARIFDPFFTTKSREHGTGLGLSVSHGIITEHGGELRLDNQPGHGASFSIELPCAPLGA